MGTRNLTVVMIGGEYKIAQYGQWNGYPSGQGVKVLNFLSSGDNIELLKSKLPNVRYVDFEGKDKDFIENYEKNAPKFSNEPDNRTKDQKEWFERYITRDLGAKILANVAMSNEDEVLLKDSIDFADESCFCEFAYCIDLDEGTLEVFDCYGESNNERFKNLRRIGAYSLGELPSEEKFLSDLEKEDD